jgi:selenoprotein W-related protein
LDDSRPVGAPEAEAGRRPAWMQPQRLRWAWRCVTVPTARIAAAASALPEATDMPASPMVEITYCRLCGWGLRAGWMAQELLATFAEEMGSVALTPDASGGVFEVRVDGELVWSRKAQGRFPDLKELKQLVRDRIAPARSLGHSDAPAGQSAASSQERSTGTRTE